MTPGPIPTRVLLIEDNSRDADLFRLALSKAPPGTFQVEAVDRMSAAVRRTATGLLDVLVLDLTLPDSVGIETLRTMRRAAPMTPIVVLTGEDDEQVVHQALLEGAEDYIVKRDLEGRTIARALLFAIARRLFHENSKGRDPPLYETPTRADNHLGEGKKLEGTLILAGRMSSIGTLASGIAHEINNPLSYVISNLEFIGQELRELAAEPGWRLRELTHVVDQAREGAERVCSIVRGLKIFGRADVQESRAPVELRHVLELAIDLTFHEIRHRARLVKSYGATPCVEADEARLSQVFVNLLVNAAQAIGDGAVAENEIRIETSTDSDGRAVVEIADTGCGILEAHRTQIFDPFFTTKAVGLGAGLGLSIIHGIVTSHGGEITLENARGGKGATFRVVLPAAREQADPQPFSVFPAPHLPAGRRGRVLIVDDEPLVAAALRRVLTVDHDVATSANGREAMTRFDRGERFDVVLCDIVMPVMNGVALYEEIARAVPQQADKFVFISAGAFTPAAKSFLERVPNARLEKPFESTNLRAVVRSFVPD